MIDISDKLKVNGDVNYVDSFIYKTRNVLSMRLGDDPYYPTVGLKTDTILNYNINILVINAYISQYLGDMFITPEEVNISNDQRGTLNIGIVESFSYLIIKNGVLLNSKIKKTTEKLNVKLQS